MIRTFEDKPAKRERVPMLVGLVGPSGSGKTYSALRLATGMQRATGGDIFFIDTESRRALHYADEFSFRHTDMDEPFSSLDYMAAIHHCVNKKAGIVIVDSTSHEHDGPGGMLESHEKELERLAGNDYKKRERVKFLAWAKPKAARRKLINEILRLGVNAIFCFRAKPKLKIVKGEDPINLGWQPIAGDEFIYEMTINCLLYPGSEGVPNWAPDEAGERVMLKKPKNLAHVFKDGKELSEATGEALAQWAAGEDRDNSNLDAAVAELQKSTTVADLDTTRERWIHHEWSEADKSKLRDVVAAVKMRIAKSEAEEGGFQDGEGEGFASQ